MLIPDYVNEILAILEANGFEGFVVGGCVRDALLGKTPNDYDIAVSSAPEETKMCFRDFRTISTGEKHGTVTVVNKGKNLELTSFRLDGEYKDSRRPENVEFTRSIEADLSRRDFTINAMAYNKKSLLVDIFGGQKDLENKIIRCVGEADVRFSEDALRIMRAVRFASQLGFAIEEKTAESIHKNRNLLKNISVERIFVELKKLLTGKNATKILIRYRDVFETVLPELKELSEEKYIENANAVGKTADEITAFSALLASLTPECAEKICTRLKTDKHFRSSACILVQYAYEDFSDKLSSVHFINKHSVDTALRLISLKESLSLSVETIKTAVEYINNGGIYTLSQLQINGNDLSLMGIKGKDIAVKLNMLLDKVILGEVSDSKEELKKLL